MKLTITISMDNAAFGENWTGDTGSEVARILGRLQAVVDGHALPKGELCRVIDSNGNVVGTAKVTR